MRNVLIFMAVFSIGITQGFCQGFPTLKLGGGSRAGAMGMAYTALSDDGSAGFWNPAGLSFLRQRDVLLSIHRWIEDVNSEFVCFGWGNQNSGMGIHLLYTEVGGIEHRIVPSPTPLAVFSVHEVIGGISYARKVHERLSIGLTLKMLYEKIFVDEAWGIAGDLGFLWKVWDEGLRIGGVLQNVGRTGRLQEEEISLPVTGRIGMAFPVQILRGRWIFVVDGVKERGSRFHIHGGGEYGWNGVLYFRCGYQAGYEIRGVTGGVGVVWRGYRLDYSYMPLRGGLGDSHRLTVGIGW